MRRVVAAADGVALATPADGDAAALAADWDNAFDVDPDDRPQPPPVALGRAVVLDAVTGALLGQVTWHEVRWGRTRACAAWNVGIALLPAARGRGAGARALRLLTNHLFATTDLDRVEAATDVDNAAARRALLAAGFLAEGVVRGAQLRGGVRRDLALFGVLRGDRP
ncbi:GNAT family N-acetyltransferase [Actinokineospora iranica]|uniref:Acetyltransferase (GNAT) domain-containing protein n=1 Tax=Actinokineospora iranica TaxID=1271860 RepID=A0A1G6Z8C0_9PSEU|nr:GNAT family N-acetyltransferase [Actinokineospora iranica]SDD98135.1 Acetyltransferase (GNAT) domain-containing protein [Actinokineospora iranica]